MFKVDRCGCDADNPFGQLPDQGVRHSPGGKRDDELRWTRALGSAIDLQPEKSGTEAGYSVDHLSHLDLKRKGENSMTGKSGGKIAIMKTSPARSESQG